MQQSLDILYGQLAVYRPELGQLNLWNDLHVAQGFAWREGNVSFGIPDHDGPSMIVVDFAETPPPLDPECLRAVRVPLRVNAEGAILATVMDEIRLAMAAGDYEVQFELHPGFQRDDIDYAYLVRLVFIPNADPDFVILKGDGELTATEVLTTEAKPTM